ncbi:MAG: GWxTD domain-containing protein [Bacteroidetes bacterium]|nr:GWxTD domain-containing protein [Bacteroidota bacterium]
MRKVIKMAGWYRYIMICLLIGSKAWAIDASVSYTVFYAPDANTFKPYIELYWQIDPNSIHFTEPTTGTFISTVKTEIALYNDKGIIKRDNYILKTNPANNLKAAFSQTILSLQRYFLPEGKVYISINLKEMIDTSNTFTYIDSVTIATKNSKPFLSGIQLLDTAYSSTEQNVFSKNNMQTIPLCANFYDQHRNTMYVYTESYNSASAIKTELPLVQTIFISKKPFSAVLAHLTASDTITNSSAAFPAIHRFDLSKISSGNYYINAIIENIHHEHISETSLFFQRVNIVTEAVIDNAKTDSFENVNIVDLSTTFVSKYTLPQLKAILKMIKPISNPIETSTIDHFIDLPDENYMRYFIYNFWKSRNTKKPEKAWEDYTVIVKEVNSLYKGGGTPGYETDRGITYLKYGKPNDVVTVNNEAGALPYEIWIYNVLPKQSLGGLFLFYRPGDNMNDYKMLHSNVPGEARNTSWRTYLYVGNGSSSGNLNARAEQYFPGSK